MHCRKGQVYEQDETLSKGQKFVTVYEKFATIPAMLKMAYGFLHRQLSQS